MSELHRWEEQRSHLLSTGEEVHKLFNLSRKIGEIVTLDFIRIRSRQRLICYPSTLSEGMQPIHPDYLPFELIYDGALSSEGVDIRLVPDENTKPLVRIANSFDTPQSGAPRRAEIFRLAGNLLGASWVASGHYLPEQYGLQTICFIPEGEGKVAFVPPATFVHVPEPRPVVDQIVKDIKQQTFAADSNELIYEFKSGVEEAILQEGEAQHYV